MKKQLKIGLALGGGAARGWSHIGVIRALEKAKIPIHCIAGTSIGALIGGVYASGKLDELEELAINLNWRQVMGYLDMAYSKNGLLDGKKVKKLLSSQFTKKSIQQASVPFIAIATDLDKGKEIKLKSGNLVEAIRASISIPGIFTPVKYGKRYLVDGGLVNPVPVNVARQMGADIVIAVDLNKEIAGRTIRKVSKSVKIDKSKNIVLRKLESAYQTVEDSVAKKIDKWLNSKEPNIFDVIGNSINIMQHKIAKENLLTDPPDILIQPKLGPVKLFDFHRAEAIIKIGEAEAKKYIKSIENLAKL